MGVSLDPSIAHAVHSLTEQFRPEVWDALAKSGSGPCNEDEYDAARDAVAEGMRKAAVNGGGPARVFGPVVTPEKLAEVRQVAATMRGKGRHAATGRYTAAPRNLGHVLAWEPGEPGSGDNGPKPDDLHMQTRRGCSSSTVSARPAPARKPEGDPAMSTISSLITDLTAAETEVARMDDDAERARILASAAKPATRKQVAAKAAADARAPGGGRPHRTGRAVQRRRPGGVPRNGSCRRRKGVYADDCEATYRARQRLAKTLEHIQAAAALASTGCAPSTPPTRRTSSSGRRCVTLRPPSPRRCPRCRRCPRRWPGGCPPVRPASRPCTATASARSSGRCRP